jgi:hypothetical protein
MEANLFLFYGGPGMAALVAFLKSSPASFCPQQKTVVLVPRNFSRAER